MSEVLDNKEICEVWEKYRKAPANTNEKTNLWHRMAGHDLALRSALHHSERARMRLDSKVGRQLNLLRRAGGELFVLLGSFPDEVDEEDEEITIARLDLRVLAREINAELAADGQEEPA